MGSWKRVAPACLSLVLFAALATPASAGDEPNDEPQDPLGRGAAGRSPDATAKEAGPSRRDGAADAVDPGKKPEGDQGSKGFGWPWGGPRSPEWTQDWTWTQTHFWMIDTGHVELDARWDGALERRTRDLDQLWKVQARMGLLPHIELGVTENVSWPAHGDAQQEGNEIGARFCFWDYGTIPLNPCFEVVWHPRHNATDEWEGRAMIGFELFSRFFLAADGFFRGETGGAHNYTWGFHAAATFELIEHVLRVGAEGGITWQFSPDHKEAFRDTDPEVGPTVVFRPLALFKASHPDLIKLTIGSQIGARDDNTNVPYARFIAIVGVQF